MVDEPNILEALTKTREALAAVREQLTHVPTSQEFSEYKLEVQGELNNLEKSLQAIELTRGKFAKKEVVVQLERRAEHLENKAKTLANKADLKLLEDRVKDLEDAHEDEEEAKEESKKNWKKIGFEILKYALIAMGAAVLTRWGIPV